MAAALAAVAPPLDAQSALVLSGGGARGIAHAGVVRALDSLGLEPDIVVGTSMGAVVAGLYASGLGGREVWEGLIGQRWSTLFDPRPVSDGPRWEARHPLLRVDLGGGQDRMAKGFVSDWRINRLLVHTLFEAGVRAGSDFDRLPRRYRAVAVDLRSGEPVVLSRGDLARSVRMSMAIPGVFAALGHEGGTLVDGGLANYLPIGVARRMGAGFVVASDVILPVEPLESMSPATIGSRGFHWLSVRAREDGDTADVTVYPDLPPSVTAGSFLADVEEIASTGYRSTVEAVSGETLPSNERRNETRRQGPGAPERLEDGVDVRGTEDAALAGIVAAAMSGAVGDYRTEAVLDAVDDLYATGLFDGVWPSVDGDGPVRRLRVAVEPTVPRLVAGGAGYDTDLGGRAWLSAGLRSSWGRVPVAGRVSGFIGDWERYLSAGLTLYPPSWVPASVTLAGHVSERRMRDATIDGGAAEVRRDGMSAVVERPFSGPDRALVARLVVERVAWQAWDGQVYGASLSWTRREPLPRVLGVAPRLEGEVRFGDVSYWSVRAGGSRQWSLGPLMGAVVADLAYTGDDAPPDALPALGEGAIPGFRWGEGRGRGVYAGGIDLGYPIPLAGVLRLRLRGGWLEGPFTPVGEEGDVYGFDLSGVWRTPFGSIRLGGGGNTEGSWRLDLAVGSLW